MIIVEVAGHLGRDPETRFTPSGQKVTSLTLATNIRKAGKDETVWWRVTIWGERFDKMLPYFKKGSALIIVGEMGKPNIWTDKEGRPQVGLEMTAEIIKFSPFGGPDRENKEQAGSGHAYSPAANASGSQDQGGYGGDSFGDFNAPQQNQGGYRQASGSNAGAGSSAYGQNAFNDEKLPF